MFNIVSFLYDLLQIFGTVHILTIYVIFSLLTNLSAITLIFFSTSTDIRCTSDYLIKLHAHNYHYKMEYGGVNASLFSFFL